MSIKSPYKLDNSYYLKIKEFTSLILDKTEHDLKDILFDYKYYLKNTNTKIYIENDNYEEYLLESLLLGVMWKNYINIAISLDPFYQNILSKLSKIRNNSVITDNLKIEIDEIRGLLLTKHIHGNEKDLETKNLNLENLNLLLNCLEAIGDYQESLKHLYNWRDFLKTKSKNEISIYLSIILEFTELFKINSENYLAKYTSNVGNYVENNLSYHINKEDIIFSTRNELEYHLNMFASEIMNRVFKKEFHKKEDYALALPKCMKDINENNCKAINDDIGLKCISCNKNCNIGLIAEEGINSNNFKTYIIEHNSTMFKNTIKESRKKIAILGVSCVNNLIEGGWKLSFLEIPSQCVCLDYVGCESHWNCNDISTNFNYKELYKILKIGN